MPALSFISLPKAPKAPRWISKVPRPLFSAARVDPVSLSPPHPYAFPEIIDIHGHTTHESVDEQIVSKKRSAQVLSHTKVDYEVPPDPFGSDWFQTTFNVPPSRQSPGGSKTAAGRTVGSNREGTSLRNPQEEAQHDDDDDFDRSTSEDDVLDYLKSMDASTFVNLPTQPSHPFASNKTMEQTMPKRSAPTPIKIPNMSMHGAQVQIVRSAEANDPHPLSEVSSVESSAISGQTLARALIGNSFVLSPDSRSSRYRNGLVRCDSTTLPRGDHSFMNSPIGRDRTLSGTSDNFSADKNVPPVPSNAERVYVPPRTPRHSGTGTETRRKAKIRRRSSTGSLVPPPSRSEANSVCSRPNSIAEFTAEKDKDVLALHRKLYILETPSSVPTITASPGIYSKSPSVNPGVSPKPKHSAVELSPISPEAPSSLTELTPPPPPPPPVPQSIPRTSPVPSPSTTLISSAKESEDILDYYSFSEKKPEKPFSPAFSPIAEEFSWELSSPASKRLSTSGMQKNRDISPLLGTTNGRFDLSTVRKPSDEAIIGGAASSHRHSLQTSSNPSSALPTHPGTSSITSQGAPLSPLRPPGTVVKGRLRFGSVPSPIEISRCSEDLNTYKILSLIPERTLDTPSTGDDGRRITTHQTFPETPRAFSPFLSASASSTSSPGMIQRLPEGHEFSPMPHTPMSAACPFQRRNKHPNQTMLTRAYSALNHMRKGSNASARGPVAPPTPEDVTGGTAQEVEVSSEGPSAPLSDGSASYYSQRSDEPRHEGADAATARDANIADMTPPSSIGSFPLLGNLNCDPSSRSMHSPMSANPISPQIHQSGSRPQFTNPFAAEQTLVPSSYNRQSLRPISEISQNLESPPPYDTIHQDRPLPVLNPGSFGSSNDAQSSNSFIQSSQQAPQNLSDEFITTRKNSKNVISNYRRERVRPTGPRRQLSHASNNSISRSRMPSDASVISTGATSSSSPPQNVSTPPTDSRPQPIDLPSPNPSPDPQSPGINPLLSGTTVAANPAATPLSRSPSFNVPAMPYRGLTMDQAKWTFTSSQLQSIVSRAIKQSAEASSIRLLRLEVLDNEIPQELARLQNRRTEIQSNFRSLTRSSEILYSKLNNEIVAGNSMTQETLKELRDTTRQLNILTEELHSVDQQHAQIQNLVQIHHGSALSMALRKLNTSFLKQLTQAQELRAEISDMRDELSLISEKKTMKRGQENQSARQSSSSVFEAQVSPDANVSGSPVGGASVLGRKRSHKAPIMRQPSLIRLSRPVAWNRGSRSYSLGSSCNRSSGIKTSATNLAYGVLSVRPLDRRRPTNITTDDPLIRSTTMSLETPNTEVRAMLRAQDELYRMLGLSLPDSRTRRRHSVIGTPEHPATSTNSLQFHPTASRLLRTDSSESMLGSYRVSRVDGQSQSYPVSLLDAYNMQDADQDPVLTTLDLLSQDAHPVVE